MPWRLLVIDGADEGRYFPLPDDETTTLGHSRKNCDVFLHDLYVLRVHCQVQVTDAGVRVLDCEDSAGTFVNGQRVKEKDLQPGDVIRVGNSHLRLEMDDGTYAEDEAEEGGYEEVAEEAGYEEVADDEPAAAPASPAAPAKAVAAVQAPGKLPHLPAARMTELTGHTLSHFELGQVLGKGHHGVVFRARDLKGNQVVAVKVLAPEFPADEAEMQRFVKVLKTTLTLRHPHLVSHLGAGKSGPYCWIALEYVEGESAADVLQRVQSGAKLNWRHGLRLAVHVARALDFIHQHHQSHGNVTPRNILIHLGDKVTKLADWELTKALQGTALRKARREAKMLAELPYLAPEQVDPKAFTDGLSDIYNLGAVTYARLTGRPPFQGETPKETIAQIFQGRPIKPRELQPSIPARLEAIVLKMLARRQEDRFQSARELLDFLEHVAKQEEVPV